MSHFNVDSQFTSVVPLSLPLIPNGTYRIKNQSSNTYLDCTNGLVAMKQSNHGESQEVGRLVFINHAAPIYSRLT